MTKTKEDYKSEIIQKIIPATQSLLKDILGKNIEVDVQWESLEVKNELRAYEALTTWNG